MNSLVYRFLGNTTSFDSAVNKVQSGLSAVSRASGAVTMAGAKLGIMGTAMAAPFALLTTGALRSAGAFEQTMVSYEVMLGSAQKAQSMMADLTQFAATTPFSMGDIEGAARGLAQFGERGDELMSTLNFLGNAAAGTGTNFAELGMIYNQVRGVGKLLTEDFRQLSTRGVISLQDVADHFGTTTAAAQELMTSGKVSFDDLKTILGSLSGPGGRFADLMEKQSHTFLGMLSTIKDAIGIQFREVGTTMLPVAKMLAEQALVLLDVFGELSPTIKAVVAIGLPLGAALGFAAIAAGGLLAAIGAVLPLLAAGASAVVGLAGTIGLPFTLAAAGAAAVAAGLAGVIAYTTDWKSALAAMWGYAETFATNVVGFFYNIRENFGKVTSWIGQNWFAVLTQLPGAAVTVFGQLGINMVTNMATIGKGMYAAIEATGWAMADALTEIFNFIWDGKWMWHVATAMQGALDAVADLQGQMVKTLVTGAAGNLFGSIMGDDGDEKDAAKTLKEKLARIAAGAWDDLEAPKLDMGFDLPGMDLNFDTPWDKAAEGADKAKEAADKAGDAIEGAEDKYRSYRNSLNSETRFDISQVGLRFGLDQMGAAKPAEQRRNPWRRDLTMEANVAKKQMEKSEILLAQIVAALNGDEDDTQLLMNFNPAGV